MDKIQSLLEQMSIEEKIAQMLQLLPIFYGLQGEVTGPMSELSITDEDVWESGSVLGVVSAKDMKEIQQTYLEKSANKIPLLFMLDVIHGFKTIFPIPLAMGCSFNEELFREMAEVSGKEAAVSGIQVTFSPMADLVRDPRWGRVMESTGEDHWLNGLFAAAMVKGYQENREKEYRISACIKHFAAYGAVEGGREYNTVDISDWMLREYYLPSYKAAIEAGCDLVMSSFNTIHGIPATGNTYLLEEILRDEWNFDGVIISDWAAVNELLTHGVAENGKEAAFLARIAGVDIEMMTSHYVHYLKELVGKGRIAEETINQSARRVLVLKEKRGLFENPFGAADEEKEKEFCLCERHRKKALQAATESMVLLKNGGILPLNKQQKIAIIGPMAKQRAILGGWRALGREEDSVSLWEGMRQKVAVQNLLYAKGCDIEGKDLENEEELLEVMRAADVIVLALGEEQDMTGEAASYATIRLHDTQLKLVTLAKSAAKPIVTVLFNGRPLVLAEWIEKTDALLEAWFPGTEGGNAVAGLLFGDTNPSGRLTMSFPRTEGQIPVYYNCFRTGRPRPDGGLVPFVSSYRDIANEPLFPFGYGLGYSEFLYSNRRIEKNSRKSKKICKVLVTLKNVGKFVGTEVVQLYLQDEKGCVVRPARELKGFKKIVLIPGEEREVEFEITEDMLSFHNTYGKKIVQPGNYKVVVGSDSREKVELNLFYDGNSPYYK